MQERYLGASKKEKGKILDEYYQNTGQNRKYVIRKIRSQILSEGKPARKRGWVYDGHVIAALAQAWHIYDNPCGHAFAS